MNKRSDLRNQIPQDRSMPTMERFPQPNQMRPKINFVDRFAPAMDRLKNTPRDPRFKDVFKSNIPRQITARADDVKGLNLNIGDIDPITGTIFTGFPKPPPPPVTTTALPNTRTVTLPSGQTVQIPEINMEELNANLVAASGFTPQMPRPTAMGAGLGRMFDSPMMTASALESTGATPQPFSGGILGKGTPTQTTTPVDMGTQAPAITDRPVAMSTIQPESITKMPAPLAPYTGSNTPDPNYIPSLVRNETGLDALTQQLLFGLDGQGGFIPGAMRAAEKTFFNPDGTPRVVEERRAELTPDQIASMDLVRRNIGAQDPFLEGAESQFRQSIGDVGEGIERGRELQREGLTALQSGIGGLGTRLGVSEELLKGTVGGYDPMMTDKFYNPYEQKVVEQTIADVLEAGDKQDMAQRARDIMTGGQSAFGSRARLTAGERRRDLGRGLAEALGGIRSRGFSEAQQTGLGEFARQRQAERLASTGLAGLAGTRFGAAQTGAGALSNLGNIESMYGQTLGGARVGLGGNLQNLGTATQQAGAFDVSQLFGSGGMQQAQNQAVLDAQRANQLTAQAAPLAQYQALSPFIQMVPKGSFQTSTQFAPRPSPMMAGIGVGLSSLGALGNLANQPRYPS